MLSRRSRRTAFSLMELLAVVTILGVIAAIIIPRVIDSADRANTATCEHNCTQLNAAIERYRNETGSWPSVNLNEINNSSYFPGGIPTCPVTGETYRLDTVGGRNRVIGHADGNHTP